MGKTNKRRNLSKPAFCVGCACPRVLERKCSRYNRPRCCYTVPARARRLQTFVTQTTRALGDCTPFLLLAATAMYVRVVFFFCRCVFAAVSGTFSGVSLLCAHCRDGFWRTSEFSMRLVLLSVLLSFCPVVFFLFCLFVLMGPGTSRTGGKRTTRPSTRQRVSTFSDTFLFWCMFFFLLRFLKGVTWYSVVRRRNQWNRCQPCEGGGGEGGGGGGGARRWYLTL